MSDWNLYGCCVSEVGQWAIIPLRISFHFIACDEAVDSAVEISPIRA